MLLGLWIARNVNQVRGVMVAGSSCLLAMSVWLTLHFISERAGGNTEEMILHASTAWFPALHINYEVGVDGLAVVMLLLSSIIVFTGTFSSWDLSPVRGSEQGGIRPVLIIQNDIGNKHSPTTIVAAITSRQTKAKLPTHVEVAVDGLTKDSIVLLEQIRTIDKNRLTDYVGRLDKETMGKVDKAIVISFGIKYLEELLR